MDDETAFEEHDRLSRQLERAREDEAEIAEYWTEQSRLPLSERDWLWWSEVALSNAVAALLALAIIAFWPTAS